MSPVAHIPSFKYDSVGYNTGTLPDRERRARHQLRVVQVREVVEPQHASHGLAKAELPGTVHEADAQVRLVDSGAYHPCTTHGSVLYDQVRTVFGWRSKHRDR